VGLGVTATLREEIAHRPNQHGTCTRSWEAVAGIGWHEPTSADLSLAGARSVSVVIPACDVAYCLPAVLDALDGQHNPVAFEVILVDDASEDETATIVADHRIVTRAIRLPRRMGAATARNLGTVIAQGQTVVYLDADMVLPSHVITDVAARASDTALLVGFRHNLPYNVHQGGHGVLAQHPNLAADHRVTWQPPVGQPLLYTGTTLTEPVDGRPLDATGDFVDLGYGRRYYDWDLARMVVTALLAVPRAAVLDVGGFDAGFGRIGWGMEDTYLGACLIAAGLLVIPLRQAVGYHLDPPDAEQQWQHKLARWPATLTRYWDLMGQPAPTRRTRAFTTAMTDLLRTCEVLR
jgi:GT2 family glycosyltransferase